ncbi:MULTISPECIES: DUF692 domain-containing protein [Sphingomonadaceae]|jgi:uncharacterized protein (UPF0276 family)|uniref:MNIO family bufferin maturase n=1 Tax=Sphingomonadales TaxID=204457 RepID=UPI0012BB4852|nr:DUF692 domain-containing protein [Sphingobium sp. CAP-1]QGP77840.1 DUF692 family protein [Sphingobium sp. CAP-1]
MSMTAGLGFKLEHLDEALTARNPGLWFEVHAENYMVDGGPRLRALVALASQFPISLHGVGLSLASAEPPTPEHLTLLRRLVDRIQPAAVSDHLAWQKWEGAHHADFLPFPRTREALAITADNVARVQDALGRAIMVENPSLYVDLPGHELDEAAFLSQLATRTGCGLLVDVNNIFVSAANLNFSAEARIDAIPASIVGEIHLAGHRPDPDPTSGLLIDSHDASVSDPVWLLYQRLIDRIGPRPTIIERDDEIPQFNELMLERDRAHRLLEQRMPVDA